MSLVVTRNTNFMQRSDIWLQRVIEATEKRAQPDKMSDQSPSSPKSSKPKDHSRNYFVRLVLQRSWSEGTAIMSPKAGLKLIFAPILDWRVRDGTGVTVDSDTGYTFVEDGKAGKSLLRP